MAPQRIGSPPTTHDAERHGAGHGPTQTIEHHHHPQRLPIQCALTTMLRRQRVLSVLQNPGHPLQQV